MSRRTRILVVEDAPDLREELVDYLKFQGLETAGVGSIAEMRAHLTVSSWHILVLDVGLPDGDGVILARELREQHGLDLGIIMMSARGLSEDRITGVRAGADNYLVKPIDARELLAVIEQLTLRLSLPTPEGARRQEPSGRWHLDTAKKMLCCPNLCRVTLTGAETLVLEALLEAKGAIVSRETLVQKLHGQFNGRETRRLDSLLSRLRTKVKQETGIPFALATFRNIGFAFRDAISEDDQAP